jgi:hypothetical protein
MLIPCCLQHWNVLQFRRHDIQNFHCGDILHTCISLLWTFCYLLSIVLLAYIASLIFRIKNYTLLIAIGFSNKINLVWTNRQSIVRIINKPIGVLGNKIKGIAGYNSLFLYSTRELCYQPGLFQKTLLRNCLS